MAAPVILVEAAPRNPTTGAAVTVRLAGGGAVLPYFYGGEHWRAGIAGLPKSVSSLDFNGEQLGGGGVAQALELRWAPGSNAALGELAALFWTDAPVAIRIGPEGDALPPVAATGLVLETAVDGGALRIALADRAADLKRPLLVDRYAGTGGVEGPVEFEGAIKPRAWGRCFNILGRAIDVATNIWCFGDPRRSWDAFVQVRDMGAAADAAALSTLAWQGSAEATFAALKVAAAIAGGGVLAPSIACVKWWTAPAGDLRADIRGENAGGYVETAAAIAARIVAARSSLAFAPGAIAAAAAARPAPFGWRVENEGGTAAAEISELLAGVSLSWLIVDDAVEFRAWDWSAPARTIRSEGVTRSRVYKPVATRKLGYRRNWSPMQRGDLAAIVLARDVVYEDGRTIEEVIAAVETTPGPAGPAGAPGLNGSDGAPGAAGANGVSSYTHSAYADSLDGSVNFTVDAPQGRGFRGEYIDSIAADSTDPAAYVWSEYRGPAAFGLAITGQGYLRGNMAVKTANTDTTYDFQAYSTEGWRGGAQTTFRFTNNFGDAFAGLNSDPTADTSYTSIDFGWFAVGGALGFNQSMILLNGTLTGIYCGAWDERTTFQIIYDGRSVRWLKDGALVHVVEAPANLLLYFDSAIRQPNVGVKDIAFGAAGAAGADGAAGLNGSDGINGSDGRNGADGRTPEFHFAWSDSADGTVNFTTGAQAGRAWQGVYVDYDAGADSTNPAAYSWSRYTGQNGQDGADGIDGADGTKIHKAYANSADGTVDFSVTNPNRLYLGLRIDYVVADSTNPADYGWSLIKGADGAPGAPGAPGTPGAPGATADDLGLGVRTSGQASISLGTTSTGSPVVAASDAITLAPGRRLRLTLGALYASRGSGGSIVTANIAVRLNYGASSLSLFAATVVIAADGTLSATALAAASAALVDNPASGAATLVITYQRGGPVGNSGDFDLAYSLERL